MPLAAASPLPAREGFAGAVPKRLHFKNLIHLNRLAELGTAASPRLPWFMSVSTGAPAIQAELCSDQMQHTLNRSSAPLAADALAAVNQSQPGNSRLELCVRN